MENHFSELVDINFTAEMEENLDSIADGDNDWIEYLRQFYLGEDGLAARVREKEENVSPRTIFAFRLDDPKVEVRIGRYGPFISWEEDGETLKASIPPSIPPADLNTEFVRRIMLQKSEGPLQLGTDPESGLPVYFKIGPFGYYLQRGENGKGKDKPKRVKLPEEFDPEDLRLETALKLLSLPRPLGKHPESGKSVRAGLGRFGPYVVHDGTYASLKNSVQLLEIEL